MFEIQFVCQVRRWIFVIELIELPNALYVWLGWVRGLSILSFSRIRSNQKNSLLPFPNRRETSLKIEQSFFLFLFRFLERSSLLSQLFRIFARAQYLEIDNDNVVSDRSRATWAECWFLSKNMLENHFHSLLEIQQQLFVNEMKPLIHEQWFEGGMDRLKVKPQQDWILSNRDHCNKQDSAEFFLSHSTSDQENSPNKRSINWRFQDSNRFGEKCSAWNLSKDIISHLVALTKPLRIWMLHSSFT